MPVLAKHAISGFVVNMTLNSLRPTPVRARTGRSDIDTSTWKGGMGGGGHHAVYRRLVRAKQGNSGWQRPLMFRPDRLQKPITQPSQHAMLHTHAKPPSLQAVMQVQYTCEITDE